MQEEPTHQSQEAEQMASLPMIYILGNSHSGSTLLGFLLASHPDVVFLGEIKIETWLKNRFCSCGMVVSSCLFYQNFFDHFNELKKKAFDKVRGSGLYRFAFRKRVPLKPENKENFKQLYGLISHQVKTCYPHSAFLADSSKTVWLLNAWLQVVPEDKIKIIWIRRQVKANVASFVKRGNPFLPSLFSILVNDWLCSHFLRRNKLKYLVVNYDRFYEDFENETGAISGFLGIQIPSVYTDQHNHHVISGNKITRKSFTTQFKGIYKDDEWQNILSGFQKKILSWIS